MQLAISDLLKLQVRTFIIKGGKPATYLRQEDVTVKVIAVCQHELPTIRQGVSIPAARVRQSATVTKQTRSWPLAFIGLLAQLRHCKPSSLAAAPEVHSRLHERRNHPPSFLEALFSWENDSAFRQGFCSCRITVDSKAQRR